MNELNVEKNRIEDGVSFNISSGQEAHFVFIHCGNYRKKRAEAVKMKKYWADFIKEKEGVVFRFEIIKAENWYNINDALILEIDMLKKEGYFEDQVRRGIEALNAVTKLEVEEDHEAPIGQRHGWDRDEVEEEVDFVTEIKANLYDATRPNVDARIATQYWLEAAYLALRKVEIETEDPRVKEINDQVHALMG